MINSCFHIDDKDFIGITRYGAIWTNIEKYKLSFTWFESLWSLPSTFFGNLFLYYYQRRWLLQKFSKTSKSFAYCQMLLGLEMTYTVLIIRHLKIITMIFVLMSWNWIGEMEIVVNPFWNWAEVHDKKLTRKLFDKKNAFSFYINRMPYLDINIPSKTFYALVGSEILRIFRTIANLLICSHVLILCWYGW